MVTVTRTYLLGWLRDVGIAVVIYLIVSVIADALGAGIYSGLIGVVASAVFLGLARRADRRAG